MKVYPHPWTGQRYFSVDVIPPLVVFSLEAMSFNGWSQWGHVCTLGIRVLLLVIGCDCRNNLVSKMSDIPDESFESLFLLFV